MRSIIGVVFATVLLTICITCFGQETGHPGTAGGAQYYVYLSKDWELQINVYVWGRVLKPGMYSVPKTTDLVALLSLAGGPTDNADLTQIKVIRSNPGPKITMVNLRKYMRTGEASSVPVLHPGDTVVVPGTLFHTLSKVTGIISQLAVVANVYYWFFIRGK